MSWIMLFLLYIFLDCFLGKKTDAELLVVNDVLYCVPFCDEQKKIVNLLMLSTFRFTLPDYTSG